MSLCIMKWGSAVVAVFAGLLFCTSGVISTASAGTESMGRVDVGTTDYPRLGTYHAGSVTDHFDYRLGAVVMDKSNDSSHWFSRYSPMQVMEFNHASMTRVRSTTVSNVLIGENAFPIGGVLAAPDSNHAYVNMMAGDLGAVMKFCLETYEPVAITPIPGTRLFRPGRIFHSAADGNLYSFFYRDASNNTVIMSRLNGDTLEVEDQLEYQTFSYMGDQTMDPDGLYAYTSTAGNLGVRIYKVDLLDMQQTDSLGAAGADGSFSHLQHLMMDPDGRWLLAHAFYCSGRIFRIDLEDFSHAGSIVPSRCFPGHSTIDAASRAVFFTTSSQPSYVSRVTFDPLQETATGSFSVFYTQRAPIVFDQKRNKVFAAFERSSGGSGSYPDPSAIIRMNPGTLNVEASQPLEAKAMSFDTILVDATDTYVWGAGTGDDKFVQYDAESLGILDTVPIPSGYGDIYDSHLDQTRNIGYFSSRSHLIKFDLETGQILDDMAFPEMVREYTGSIDPAGDYFYIKELFTTPDRILKVRLSDMTLVDTLDLPSGWGISGMAVDRNGHHLYGFVLNGGEVRRIDLSTFSYVGALSVSGGTVMGVRADSTRNRVYAMTTGSTRAITTSPFGVEFTATNSMSNALDGAVDPFGEYLMIMGGGAISMIDLDSETTTPFETHYYFDRNRKALALNSDGTRAFMGGHDSGLGARLLRIATTQKTVALGTRFETTDWGMLKSMSFYSHQAEGNLRMGVYDDKFNLLWQSDEVENTADNDYITVDVSDGSPPLAGLSPGAYYLVWQTDSRRPVGSYTDGTVDGVVGIHFPHQFGEFPPTPDLGKVVLSHDLWTISALYDVVESTPTLNSFQLVDISGSAPPGETDELEIHAEFAASGGQALWLDISKTPDFLPEGTATFLAVTPTTVTLTPPDRPIEYYARLRNGLGPSNVLSADILLETGPPAFTINQVVSTTSTPTLSGSIDDPAATVQVTVAGQVFNGVVQGDEWSAAPASPITDGVYTITVEATDLPGNISVDSLADGLLIDTTPPEITLDAPPTAIGSVAVDYSIVDQLSGVEDSVLWVLPPGGQSFDNSGIAVGEGQGQFLYTPPQSGVYGFAITASDGLGNSTPGPSEPVASVAINLVENGPFPQIFSTDGIYLFPMTEDIVITLDVTITDQPEAVRSITIERVIGGPVPDGLDPERTAGESLAIDPSWFRYLTWTLSWPFDVDQNSPESGPADQLHHYMGGEQRNAMSVLPGSSPVIVHGPPFSLELSLPRVFYLSNSETFVSDWQLLDD